MYVDNSHTTMLNNNINRNCIKHEDRYNNYKKREITKDNKPRPQGMYNDEQNAAKQDTTGRNLNREEQKI